MGNVDFFMYKYVRVHSTDRAEYGVISKESNLPDSFQAEGYLLHAHSTAVHHPLPIAPDGSPASRQGKGKQLRKKHQTTMKTFSGGIYVYTFVKYVDFQTADCLGAK